MPRASHGGRLPAAPKRSRWPRNHASQSRGDGDRIARSQIELISSAHAWGAVVLSIARLLRSLRKLVAAPQHGGQARLVTHNQQVLIEVRDVERARDGERTGQQRPLPERLHLHEVLAECGA